MDGYAVLLRLKQTECETLIIDTSLRDEWKEVAPEFLFE